MSNTVIFAIIYAAWASVAVGAILAVTWAAVTLKDPGLIFLILLVLLFAAFTFPTVRTK